MPHKFWLSIGFFLIHCLASAQSYYLLNQKGVNANEPLIPASFTPLLKNNQPLSGILSLSFPFQWYGKTFTHFKISANGIFSFDTSLNVIPENNLSLSALESPANCIYVFWDQTQLKDVVINGDTIPSDVITYAGTQLGRQWQAFQWRLMRPVGSTSLNRFLYIKLLLFDDGEIEILHQYGSGSFTGTCGIKGGLQDTFIQLPESPNLPMGGNNLNYESSLVNRYRFIAGTQAKNAIEITQVQYPIYQEKDSLFSLHMHLLNKGSDAITQAQFGLSYEGEDTLLISKLLQLAPAGADTQIQLNGLAVSPPIGSQLLHIWVNQLNNVILDSAIKTSVGLPQLIYQSSTPKKLLHEVFSSASTAVGEKGTAQMKAVLNGKESTYYYLYYPMNFPNFGDPYYQFFCSSRFLYYQATQAPWLILNGDSRWSQNALPLTTNYNQQVFNKEFTQNALVSIDVKMQRLGQTFKIEGSIRPVMPFSHNQLRLHLVMVEKVSYQNKLGNGETEFYHLAKAMPTGALGRPVDLTAGTTYAFADSFTFKGLYRLPANGNPSNIVNPEIEHSVENFDNLYVLAFVQDDADRLVWQSAASEIQWPLTIKETQAEDFLVYPNPCVNRLTIELPKGLTALDVKIFSGEGKLHLEKQLTPQQNTLDCSNLPAGMYVLSLSAEEKISYKKVVISYKES